MYALQDYIGEDAINKALAKYIKAVAYQEPPYTTSLEFIEYIKEVTPDSLQYLIEDMFETITLYDNKTVSANVMELAEGKYEVEIITKTQKIRADSLGNEREIPINDWIDVGVLGEEEKLLYLKKHKINKEESIFTIIVDEKPLKAGIDPYNKLIDRKSDDNRIRVEFQ